MKRNYTLWTQKEIEFLIENHSSYKIRELAELLDHTPASVTRKLHENGIFTRPRRGGYNGYSEDCFNCVYDDCRKPAYELTSVGLAKEGA